jgi:hypothetical protein
MSRLPVPAAAKDFLLSKAAQTNSWDPPSLLFNGYCGYFSGA